MSDISNFVQRGTDIMLGELNVSHVSHGPCTHLSLFAITQRLTDSSDIPYWHRCVPKGVGSASPRGGCARFTLSCRLLSLGIAAMFESCRAACDWSCMRHQLNGLCCKNGLFHGLLLRSSHTWSTWLQPLLEHRETPDLQSDLVLPHCGVAAGHQHLVRKVRLKPPRRLSMNTACAAVLFFCEFRPINCH